MATNKTCKKTQKGKKRKKKKTTTCLHKSARLIICVMRVQKNIVIFISFYAISSALHLLITHLDTKDSYVRMFFIDFS